MTRLFCTLVIVTLFRHSLAQAEELATVEQARQTISRSLPFIEREGVAWKNNRKCVTCHQVSTVVASLSPSDPREFFSDAGLTSPDDIASFKVYVVTTTGNEAGSNAVTVTRP